MHMACSDLEKVLWFVDMHHVVYYILCCFNFQRHSALGLSMGFAMVALYINVRA